MMWKILSFFYLKVFISYNFYIFPGVEMRKSLKYRNHKLKESVFNVIHIDILFILDQTVYCKSGNAIFALRIT